ncbi:hypothetical protein C5167_050287 [Papaver somniferum]|uniref:Uncharacterized protein n=1 Tax=Papaver somniferum TaxID=3469 RepID=A0A4Y7KN89_PAPSO|nr:uncharacterized protein LOC113301163 [Papaver somniferum]RZC74804.1 hypothetical protein C5167_050287 [Papaver somniferum]
MTLLDNTLCSCEVTKLDDSEVPNLCRDNDVQGIQKVEVEEDSVKIQTVGKEEENIEIVTNMKVKIERELTLSQIHEDCFLPETFVPENLCGRVLQSPQTSSPTFSLGFGFSTKDFEQGFEIEEGPSEISTREISTNEQTEILAGSQTSMDDEPLIKRLDRISNKRKLMIVPEIEPKVATPTKDVIARIQKMLKKPIAVESLENSIDNLVDHMPLRNLEKSIDILVDHISASVVQSTKPEGSIFTKESKLSLKRKNEDQESKYKGKKERVHLVSPLFQFRFLIRTKAR